MTYPIQTEAKLYEQIDQYITLKYPHILKRWDSGGIFTPSHLQRNLYGRLNKPGYPDLFIAHPIEPVPGVVYYGLFIEIKRPNVRLKKRDGSWANEHIERQAAVLKELRKLGYASSFAVGFDETVRIIDGYMSWPVAPSHTAGEDTALSPEPISDGQHEELF